MNITLSRHTHRLVLAGTVLAATTLSFAAPAANAPFKSKQGYTIVAPAGLPKITAPSPQMDVMFASKNGASMNIIVTKVPTNTPLEASRSYARTMMKASLSKFKVLSQGSMTLNGTKALTMASSFETGTPPVPVRVLSVLTIRNGKAYAFSCGSPAPIYARYDSAFKKSLASLRWTK